jgi:HPt (histidine-containing phosphotransfer) domain-containing protein
MTASRARIVSGSGQTSEMTAGGDRSAIDTEHLRHMTLGDQSLEREVLQIFVRQSAMMLGRVSSGQAGATATAAHTLVGSARGIGAWRVAGAAERLERACREGGEEQVADAITELKAASLEATAIIGARLGVPSH